MERKYLMALKKCELFDNIEIDNINSMVPCLDLNIQNFKKNDFVVRDGDALNSFGIVLEGEASVFKESISGNRILIKNLGPGEMFGEIAAFASQNKWPALVQANTPLTVCFIRQDRLVSECKNLCQFHKTLITNMLRVVSERAMMLNKKIEYISIKTMRSKLCTFLYGNYLRNGKTIFKLPMNREQMAEFLNVSRPSMSRELSRMKEEGIIDYYLSTFKILDVDALKSYCE